MRNSISSYKESLSRLANEVLDADDELDGHPSRSPSADDGASTGRRNSWRFSRSRSPTVSPIPNGTSSVSPDEIAQYKADIQKLQASEAEIKALSFNYASMLKDKEEQLSRLREENSSLKIILAEKDAGEHVLREGSSRTLSNSSKMTKGITDMSPSRFHKNTSKGSFSKHDGLNNGNVQFSQLNGFERKNDQRIAISAETEKEPPEMLAENSRSLGRAGTNLESEVEELKAQLHKEHDAFEKLKIRLQEEHQLNESFYKELHDLKLDKENVSNQVNELQKELSEKLSELRCLQIELDRSNKEKEQGEATESLKKEIERLKKKNTILKVEKDELHANMQQFKNSLQGKADAYGSDHSNHLPQLDKVKEEMDLQIQQLEKSLNNTCKERDKALQELARLKQHLLDQELEESNKMDEDNKIIEELRSKVEYQRAQIVQLEKALKQEMAKKEDILRAKNEEFHKLSELNNALSQKVETCMNTIEAKNVELLNLQTVLGQYYAESEAKERIGRDLSLMKEESAKLSQMVKVAKEEQDILRREKADTISRLSQAERLLSESKHSITKLEEENSKLRRALEQSMTTLNRMSLDSDNYVDRRIVIKLLVTYFQRNHSKEVLDLMVRMLGFSEEEKQRIGFAQQVAGKGVVRGVLGLPGRLVGGILGGSSQEAHSQVPSENQSFADLWVDFLLKETEERERRESAEAARMSSSTEGSTAARQPSVPESRASMLAPTSDLPSIHPSGSRFSASFASNNKNRLFEPSEGEFATVPLTSSQAPLSKSGSKFPRQVGY